MQLVFRKVPLRQLGFPIGLLGAIVLFSILRPIFLTPENLFTLIGQVSILLLVALAMTLVVKGGGIDLSVGASFDVAALATATFIGLKWSTEAAILGGVGMGLLVGVINSISVTWLKVAPFLATLGTQFIIRSVQLIYTNGGMPIYLLRAPEAFRFLGRGELLGIPFKVVVAVIVFLIFIWLMRFTTYGRYVEAVGLQPEAASYSGIRVGLVTASVFIFGALLTSMGGIIQASIVRSAQPLSGDAYLLDAIGATFIGTTLNKEARPNAFGTLLGVLFFGVITNGLTLLHWNFFWQTFVKGILLFLVVLGASQRGR